VGGKAILLQTAALSDTVAENGETKCVNTDLANTKPQEKSQGLTTESEGLLKRLSGKRSNRIESKAVTKETTGNTLEKKRQRSTEQRSKKEKKKATRETQETDGRETGKGRGRE
jgi:cobalamin biosynthesis Mg chelatase CobN